MKILKKTVENIPVTILKTNKFKSVAGKLYFKSPITKEKMTTRSMLRNILMESCMKYDTKEKLYRKTLEEYDAYFSSSSQRIGNYHITSFCFYSLIDKYTKKGNLNDVVKTFCEIIFNPLVKDNSFDLETFNIIFKSMKKNLEKLKEDSSAYMERMTLKNLNQDKPYTYVSELETLNKITKESLYLDYKDMIENSSVELILAGDIDFDSNIIKEIISNIKYNRVFDCELLIDNDLEKETNEIIKEDGFGTQNIVNQVLYLKNLNHFERNFVAPLYRIILGGGSFSRLFSIIREKNSLSYYVFSRYDKDDSLMNVIMGIEKENFNKAHNLTLEIINSMKSINDEELSYAKEILISSLEETNDKILNIVGTYYTSQLFNISTNDSIIQNIKKVTKKDIEIFASKVKLGICYFLKGEDSNE